MTLQKTTAQTKIAQLKKRVRVVRGGASASKTFSIIPFLIDYAIKNPKQEISIVAETIPHLRRGALRDFLKIMDLIGMYKDDQYNKSSLIYTFKNGSFIEFFSADDAKKLRGARRDILFINECNNISWESYHQLSMRTRKFIYLDYNPVDEFWVDKELINDIDTSFVILTYKDNEALEPALVKEFEKAKEKAFVNPDLPNAKLFATENIKNSYWANWYKVYALGMIGSVQGTIYTNWEQIESVPKEAKLVGIGVDFGYTNDPTSIIAVYKWNGNYILDELEYKREMSNKMIIDVVKPYQSLVVCDSAEPKSIAELRLSNIKAMPCVKGADSVINGIQKVQALDKFFVTQRSVNTIKELRGYTWITDKNNQQINEPIGVNNHAMDSMRYILSYLIQNKGNRIIFGSV